MTDTSPLRHLVDVHSHPTLDLGGSTDANTGAPMTELPDWSADGLLDLMDEHGVAMTLLSLPDAANRIEDAAVAADHARRANEFLASQVGAYPSRLGALAVLPGRSIDGSVAEIGYALDELGLDGVSFSTSVADAYLGDPRFDPILAELVRRDATLFVHPVEAGASRALDAGLHPSMFEFMFDTTRMIATMVVNRVPQRFPELRVIATHGGGTIPYLTRRFDVLQQVFGAGAERDKLASDELLAGLRWFHLDLTAATSAAQLPAILDLLPPSQLLAGFDHPFMPRSTYAESIADLAGSPVLDDAARAEIANGTAARLFPAAAARAAG